MSDKSYMKAPKNLTSATIEGQEYKIPKSGIIEVKHPDHVETLTRHGFLPSDGEKEPLWTEMTDAELIAFIEEHGEEADASMKRTRLEKKAKKAYAESLED